MAPLDVYAGKKARETIMKNGFNPDLFSYFLGASGGPKWFTLAGLDRVLFPEWFANVNHQIHVIGSSAGAFRAICAVQNDPFAAINRLASSYSTTTYSSNKPTPREITAKAEDLLKEMVNDTGKQEVLSNSRFKAHLIVAKCLGATRFESKFRQLSGLAMSAAANTVNRKNLSRLYTRYIFSSPNTNFEINDPYQLPTQYHDLTQGNIHSALLASGSIPIVIEGVQNIEGAPAGMYRDGGIVDYHFDLSFGPD
ncbi:MAG: patatin-like phospholipase family protein, partial [Pseudomonadota bacterium]|nr:patatin-like phospholipase family protein [Pseudomonadota bacterium]